MRKKIKGVIKGIIKTVDSKILDNKISKKYSEYKRTHGEQIYERKSLRGRRYKKGKKIKLISSRELSVKDVVLAQYYNNDYTHYMHCDVAVRSLAVEEYYNKSNLGFSLYKRMQDASGFDWTDRFKTLIASYENEGYKQDSHVELDADLNIMDGSHRLTLALYHNQEFIYCDIYNGDRKRNFDIDAFWQRGFSRDECGLIEQKTNEIISNSIYSFVGVIWPPAFKIGNDLVKDLESYDPDNIKIVKCVDYYIDRKEFIHLFKALYHTDVLDEHGMSEKLRLIENSMRDDEKKMIYRIKMFEMNIKQPRISINPKNYQTQSYAVKQIKTTFRKRYESRVLNYSYDVVMHITDNYLQSKFCKNLFEYGNIVQGIMCDIGNEKIKIYHEDNNYPINIYEINKHFYGKYIVKVREYECLELFSKKMKYQLKSFDSNSWFNFSIKKMKDNTIIKVDLRDLCVAEYSFFVE